MKKISFILLGLLINYMSVYGQVSSKKGSMAVKQVLTNFFADISNVDTTGIRQNCTTNFRLLEDGSLWNIDSLTSYLPKVEKTARINVLKFTKVTIKGKVARVTYHNTAHFTAANGNKSSINWNESAVLVKNKDRWLISSLVSTTRD